MGGGLLSAFIAETAIITWRDVAGSPAAKAGHTINGLPLPADYLAAVMLYGALGFLPAGGPAKVGTLFGWGIVIATLVNFWTPSNPLKVGAATAAAGTQAPAPQATAANPNPTGAQI